ncbi:MAG: sugar porter family MFS transporter, partial [Candidatus Korobacteraceae bacterium]
MARINSFVLRGTVVGALGGLLFGFDTAVIAGTEQQLIQVFGLSTTRLGFTVATALAGTVIGAIVSGELGEKMGGREALRILAACYVVSALGCALAWSWPALLVFRFVGGLAIGGSSVLGPMYIAEIAPARWRGLLVGTFQINIVIGILVAYLSNYVVSLFRLGLNEWRWELGIAAAPALLFFVMLFTIPRSARWLVLKHRIPEGRQVIALLGADDPDAELKEIVDSIHVEGMSHSEPLFQRKYLKPMFLAATVAGFSQLAGINAIFYYSNYIFENAGFSKSSGLLQSVGLGATNLVFTLVAMSLIDKLGRKTLLLIGSVGMAICLGGVGMVFHSGQHQNLLIIFLVAYIACFAISIGAVIWVYISEVFPNRIRAKGQGLGSATHWIMNTIITFGFPVIAGKSRSAPFIFFSVMMAVYFFIVLFTYPETKGVTLEEMQHKLGI